MVQSLGMDGTDVLESLLDFTRADKSARPSPGEHTARHMSFHERTQEVCTCGYGGGAQVSFVLHV